MSRDSRLFLEDIASSCAKIVRYMADLNRDAVLRDEVRLDAILYNLHVIGEAVKRLPEPLRSEHPEIPWREISGMRDVIAHAYFALDLDIVWSAVTEDVPALGRQVAKLLRSETPDNS